MRCMNDAKTKRAKNTQINISIPVEWKKELENLARIYSVEEGKTITFIELIRRGIKEKYQLGGAEDDGNETAVP